MNIIKLIEDIEKVDPEVYERLDSRRAMFGKAGKFAGKIALAATPFALGSMLQEAYGQSKAGNIIIDTLNFALTLEYLEDEFYKKGLAAAGLIPSLDMPIFMQISQHETAHVSFLKTTINSLGGTPVAKPTFDFSGGNGSNAGPRVRSRRRGRGATTMRGSGHPFLHGKRHG